MKTNLIQAPGTCHMDVRASERASYIEYHVTATVDGSMRTGMAATSIFNQVAPALIRHGIMPIQEKLYGRRSVYADVMEKRDEAYLQWGVDRTMPVTWIEGVPLGECDFVAVQIWGIAPKSEHVSVETVENAIIGRARRVRGQGFEMLHLPCVRGTTADGKLAAGHEDQAAHMFTNIGTMLKTHGYKYTDVVRTWIYCSRLLEWYGDLNRVRTGIYRPAGFGNPTGHAFPASTGIQGRTGDEECLVDVLAVKTDDPTSLRVTPILRSPRQDSSFNYGSAFSRGVSLEVEGKKTIHISGTASINTAGDSTYLGDAEHQSVETLLSIAAILEEQGGGLQNITSATLFCKTKEAWEAWERVSRLLGVPNIPKVCVLADVCRDNLLVEMEAVAVI